MKSILLTTILLLLLNFSVYSQKPGVTVTGQAELEQADFPVNQNSLDEIIYKVNDYFLGNIEQEELEPYFLNEEETKKFLSISLDSESIEQSYIDELMRYQKELKEYLSLKYQSAQSASLSSFRIKYGESHLVKVLIPKIKLLKNDGSTEVLSFIIVEFESTYKLIKMER